jgi:hypothetical protein
MCSMSCVPVAILLTLIYSLWNEVMQYVKLLWLSVVSDIISDLLFIVIIQYSISHSLLFVLTLQYYSLSFSLKMKIQKMTRLQMETWSWGSGNKRHYCIDTPILLFWPSVIRWCCWKPPVHCSDAFTHLWCWCILTSDTILSFISVHLETETLFSDDDDDYSVLCIGYVVMSYCLGIELEMQWKTGSTWGDRVWHFVWLFSYILYCV